VTESSEAAASGVDGLPSSPAAALDLVGARVLVTGASGGIGRGIVTRFVAAGAEVVAHGRRADTVERLAALAEHVGCPRSSTRGTGPAIVAVRGDLTTPQGAAELVTAAVDLVGGLDVLVNNAGVQPVTLLGAITDDEWDEVVATNLTAVHRCTRAFVEHRRRRGGGGAVVHVASIEAHHPAIGHGHYAASKAAVVMHARAAALEFGADDVRVNVVSPGLIDRPGLASEWPDGVERWRAAAPLGRLGRPDDVGDACVALASPLLRWVTGAELVVDGGMLARPTW
jgi:NAD(P)-dependent dehydrogenase (short-subunit alcohol dehydrogenase family)